LRSLEAISALRGRGRALAGYRRGAALVVAAAFLLSGCSSGPLKFGWLPAPDLDATNQTGRIIYLWNGSWIAALVVGVLVWGLTLWCIFAYRRRRDEAGIPAQVRYHLPLEVLYTVVPLIMVGVLFFFTARDQAAIAAIDEKPDVTIGVVGKQWAWDFNYLNAPGAGDDVYEVGVQALLDGKPGAQKNVPTLYLPVNKKVRFQLTARDVIHSFWIPAFLYKMDVVPGLTNEFQLIPQRTGTFKGKCAELCGEFHSEMLFNVKVVSQADYDAHMTELKARGQTGQLETDLGRSTLPTDGPNAKNGTDD
jgi:cytochrome c oxidase subunit 2